MKKPKLVLLTAQEIRDLSARAIAFIESEEAWEDDQEEHRRRTPLMLRRSHQHWTAAKEALRFCSVSAMILGDPELIQIPIDALDAMERLQDDPASVKSVVTSTLPPLLFAGAPVTDAIRELAASDDHDVRTAITTGLRAGDDESERVLLKLAADPHPTVRAAARVSLGDRSEVPWWKGKFDSDPVIRMSTEEAEGCREALQELSKLLDQPTWAQQKAADQLAALASQLPAHVAIEVLRNVVRAWHVCWSKDSPVGPALLRLPGAFDGVLPLLAEWGVGPSLTGHWAIETLHSWVDGLDDEDGTRVRAEMLAQLGLPCAPLKESERYRNTHPMEILAKALAAAWPTDGDLAPLVARIIDAPEAPPFGLATLLNAIIERGKVSIESILPRLIEAKLADFPDRWKELHGYYLDKRFEALPPASLRPIAERAARSDDKGLAEWGWELLVGPLHDPERDGPRDELVQRLYDDPGTRSIVLESQTLRRAALEALRRNLRAGELDFAAACSAMHAIDACFGGVIGVFHWTSFDREDRAVQREEAPELAADLTGPPTSEEWATYRRVRDAALAADPKVFDAALKVLPEGPWLAEDRHLLDRAMREFRAGEQGAEVAAAYLLASKPTADAPAILDEIIAKTEDGRDIFRRCKSACLKGLGLDLAPSEEDRDDDDDDDAEVEGREGEEGDKGEGDKGEGDEGEGEEGEGEEDDGEEDDGWGDED